MVNCFMPMKRSGSRFWPHLLLQIQPAQRGRTTLTFLFSLIKYIFTDDGGIKCVTYVTLVFHQKLSRSMRDIHSCLAGG